MTRPVYRGIWGSRIPFGGVEISRVMRKSDSRGAQGNVDSVSLKEDCVSSED